MIMGLYSSVLPLLKQFVLTFEMKEPMIHELHEQLVKLFREFLACYVKPEILKSATTSAKLKRLDISTTANFLKADKMFIGIKSSQVIQKNQKDVTVKTFLHNVQDAYKNCGLTLQNKLPITNVFLKAVSAIHPDAKGHTCTLIYLQKLPSLATNVLEEDEIENYDLEIRKFQTDESIVELEDDERIDVWWGKDGIVKKYPLLSKMAQSLLSCFHGPQVESSFNIMNDIIDCKSGSINISTYNAIQNIKYSLKATEKTAVEYYKKKDVLHEKIDPHLCKNMKTACKQYKEELLKKKLINEEKKANLQIKSQEKTVSKRKAKELIEKAAKRARLGHITSASQKTKGH
ncbi:uncharacterized protein [Mytilus edulis]|uniref:uncharacterized protein n=1 Tax=Mytilus edulis TaxID=6550 RepID=UPI0039EE1174